MTAAAIVTVNAAWNNGPNDASPTWTSIGTVERLEIGPRGRTYETDQVSPTQSKVRVDNVSAANHTTQTVNLVTNPGFEGGATDGWLAQTNCSIAASTAQKFAGTYSLALTATAIGDMATYSTFAVSAGIDYAATTQVRAAVTARSVQLRFAWYNVTTLLSTSTVGTVTDSSTGWTTLSGTATAPANATRCWITAYVVGAAASEVHYIDQICATVGTAIPTYFDGTSSNAFWANGANNSASFQQSAIAIDRQIQATAVYNGTTYYLFTGTSSQTPSTLDSGGFDYASTQYTVTDFQDALATVKLRSPIIEEIVNLKPVFYFPMGDTPGASGVGCYITGLTAPAASLKASGVSATGTLALGGSAFFPATDSTTNAVFAPHVTSGTGDAGVAYRIPVASMSGLPGAPSNVWAVYAEFITSSTGTGTIIDLGNMTWGFVGNLGSGAVVRVVNGQIQVLVSGNSYTIVNPASPYNDGAPHTVLAGADGTNTYVVVDGQVFTQGAAVNMGIQRGQVSLIGAEFDDAGTQTYSNFFNGQIGHVAAWVGNNAFAHGNSNLDKAARGYAGESVSVRLGRLLRWAGFAGNEWLDLGNTPMGIQACAGKTASQECQDVALSDDGIFYFKADGSASYRQGATRYTQASKVVLGTAALPIDSSGLTFDFDRQHLVNDIQATRPGGPTIGVSDAASIARYRRRTLNNAVLTFQVYDNAGLAARASRYLKEYGRPRVRVGSIALNPYSTPALFPYCLSLEPGDRITITNLPANAPAPTMDFIVESVAHPVITEGAGGAVAGWQTVLQLAPFLEMPAWIIGDSVYGVVGATNVVRG